LVLFYFFTGDDPQKVAFFIRHLFFLNTAVSIKETFFFNPAYWSLPPEIEFYMSIYTPCPITKKAGCKEHTSAIPCTSLP
jgi:peptidoglycan/LPS O-acetylase OafA/YrhL